MGGQIALTGVVLFVFFLTIRAFARMEPRQPGLFSFCSLMACIGGLMIPIGFIIQIWS